MLNNIRDAYKKAILDKNDDRKRVLGNLIALTKNKEIELRGKGKQLANDDIVGLIQKTIKQDQEANEMFSKGNRKDLVKQNDVEIAILQAFLPKQLSDTELETAIKAMITLTGATSTRDMGKVIVQMKEKYAGQVDMSKVSGKIKELLG